MDRLEAGDEDRPIAPSSPRNTVLLSDSTSLSGSNLPGTGVGLEVQSDVLPSLEILSMISPLVAVPFLEYPSVLRAAIASSLGTFVSAPADELSTSAANIAGGSVVPLTLLARGEGQVACLFASDDLDECNFEPPALPTWRLRPYAQPLLIEELMRDSMSLSRHVKVDLIVRELSRGVTMLAALDVAKL